MHSDDSLSIRKLVIVHEAAPAETWARAAAIAILANPFVGADLDAPARERAADLGLALGKRLIDACILALGGAPIEIYGKGALIGVNGTIEHGAAIIHPKLGKAVRAAIGGGEAIMCSTVKLASTGASLDVPLAHKDDIWQFDYLDTLTVSVADAPLPDEIAVIVAVGRGPRQGSAKPANPAQ